MLHANEVKGSFAADLRKAKRTLPQYMRYFTDATSRELRDEVKKRTPIVTGQHNRSIETIDTDRRFTPTGIQVWSGGAKSDLPTMSFLEEDTAPHTITAHTKAGLVFFSFHEGTRVKREFVEHPGTTGMHMFAKAAFEVDGRIGIRGEAMLDRWAVKSGLR